MNVKEFFSKYKIPISIIVAIVVLLVAYRGYVAYQSYMYGQNFYSGGYISPVCNLTRGAYSRTLIPGGNVINIPPNSYFAINLSFPSFVCGFHLKGSFTASQGTFYYISSPAYYPPDNTTFATIKRIVMLNGTYMPYLPYSLYLVAPPYKTVNLSTTFGYCVAGMCVPHYSSIGPEVIVFVNPNNNTDSITMQETFNITN